MKTIETQNKNYQQLLCAIFDCGVLDLAVIENIDVDYSNIAFNMEQMGFKELTFSSYVHCAYQHCLSELSNAIEQKVKAEGIDFDCSEIHSDFEIYINFLCTEINMTCSDEKTELYEQYFSDEIEQHINTPMGISVSC